MKLWSSEFWADFVARIKESVSWLSVQVTAAWGAVWFIFSQLPGNVIAELSQVIVLKLSIIAWMGIAQTITTYMARMKKQAPKQ